MKSVEDQLAEIDLLIKGGDLVTARKKIDQLRLTKVPERLLVRVADILCRAGMFSASVRLLHPAMYSTMTKPIDKIASLYALSLQLIGAYTDAKKIFKGINYEIEPEANFHFASSLIANWEYENAIPHLKKYLELSQISPYRRLVAETNLSEALIFSGDTLKGKGVIEKVIKEAEKQNHKLIMGVGYKKLAEATYFEKKYDEAKAHIERAEELLTDFPSRYQLLIKFWKVIIDFSKNPEKNSASEALKKLRLESVNMGRWIIVRECDFYRSIVEKDKSLFLKVYFGTPLPAYRQRLVKSFVEPVEIPQTYIWNPTGQREPPTYVFDVLQGKDMRSGAQLKRGQALHRLLQAVSSDFYIPFKLETLFSYLFPDEYFSPITSNKKTQGAIVRLHKFFKSNKIPIALRFKDEAYRIYFQDPYGVRVCLNYEENPKFNTEGEVRRLLQVKPISAQGISDALDVPLRTIHRLLQSLMENGEATKEKIGRDVLFRITPKGVSN